MEVNIEITRSDYADFNRYYFLKKGLKKRIYIVILVAFLLPLIGNARKPFSITAYFSMVIIAGLMFGILYLGGMMLVMSRTGRLPSDKGSILGKKKFIISGEGITAESENGKTFTMWTGIQSVSENKNSIFIFCDTIAAFVI